MGQIGARDRVFQMIDAANGQDPRLDCGVPKELLYGQRMTSEQELFYPDAPDTLAIACRGQHIERWLLPRNHYPEGRTGYLEWRREQGRRHAARIAEIMISAGYEGTEADYVARMLRKEGIKSDPLVQALEDVACFTFIRCYINDFSSTQSFERLREIVLKTARKMSAPAREHVHNNFSIPKDLLILFE